MKITTIILLATLYFISHPVFSQTELLIEVTTDKYPDETSWKLYDLSQNLIAQRNSFENESTHFDTIVLDDASCYYWTIYDSYSDGMNATNPGDYKLYIDGELFAECADPNFGDSVSVYGIGQVCTTNDAAINKIAMLDYVSKDAEPIVFELINMGSEIITSFSLFYQVGDFVSSEFIFDNLNILIGEATQITAPEYFNFNEAGAVDITVTLNTVNGSDDLSVLNNSKTKTVTVVDGILKKNMVEMTSSAYCGPCYDANANINEILFAYNGTWALSKYLLDWGDKKYVPGNDHRFELYNASGAPTLFINGESRNWTTFSATAYRDDYLGNVADVKIILDGELRGDSIFASVQLIPQKDIETVSYLRGVAVEHFCTENVKSGAEYYHPSYGYLPSPEGIMIESMNLGDTLNFQMDGSIINYPLESGSLTDMILNMYVQDDVSKIIYQSEAVNLTYSVIEPETWFNIADNSNDVQASELLIEFNSNRTFFNEELEQITNVKDHFRMKRESVTGVSVPFTAEMNEFANKISITPEYDLEDGVTYYVIAKDFATLDGIEFSKDTLVFTTTAAMDYSVAQKSFIYPNPANDFVTVKATQSCEVKLFDTNARLLITDQFESGIGSISINELPKGMYLIQIISAGNSEMQKFLKQ